MPNVNDAISHTLSCAKCKIYQPCDVASKMWREASDQTVKDAKETATNFVKKAEVKKK